MKIDVYLPIDRDIRIIQVTLPTVDLIRLNITPQDIRDMEKVDNYKFLYKLAEIAERLSKLEDGKE